MQGSGKSNVMKASSSTSSSCNLLNLRHRYRKNFVTIVPRKAIENHPSNVEVQFHPPATSATRTSYLLLWSFEQISLLPTSF